MNRLHPILIAIVVGMVAIASGHAAIILNATLTNAQENPPAVPTTPTGAAQTGVIRRRGVHSERLTNCHVVHGRNLQHRCHRDANTGPE